MSPSAREHSYFLLLGIVGCFEVFAAAIVGAVMGDPAYMGGLCLIVLLLPVAPFRRGHSMGVLLATLAVLFAAGASSGMTFQTMTRLYGVDSAPGSGSAFQVTIPLLCRPLKTGR